MKPDHNYVIGVKFDGGDKVYKYKISETAWHRLHKGDRIHIKNDKGYDYRNSVVTVVDFGIEDSSMELREIVSFRRENTDKEINCLDEINCVKDCISNQIKGFAEADLCSISASTSAAPHAIGSLTSAIGHVCDRNEREENNTMNKMFGNIEFGKYTGSQLRPSWKGMAYRSGNEWVCWDKDANDLIDVTSFIINDTDFIYLMPVAVDNIKTGDIIRHNGEFVIATGAEGVTGIKTIAPQSREVKTILPAKNVFGFNFVTKVVSFVDFNILGTPTSDNPFGNMGMLMMLSGGDGIDTNAIMLMSMMQNGGKMDMSNPMMMYFMMRGGDRDALLPLMLMQNGGFTNIWSGRQEDSKCELYDGNVCADL